MLRGTIEVVTESSISGWLYSPDADLRGRVVLAFLGDECIGSGRVEIFRADLKEVGLGSGHCGFRFVLTFQAEPALDCVFIKLEGSDAVILQRGARILPPDAGPSPGNGGGAAPTKALRRRGRGLAALFTLTRDPC